MADIIVLEKMNKFYGTYHALKDVNLTIAKGEKVVVCGPSGSGKSTMIRCINRLEEHDSGRIVVGGEELTDDEKKAALAKYRLVERPPFYGPPFHVKTVPEMEAWVDGAIAMYTAEALERIDWIAEEYFLYFEDVDTGWRLAQQDLDCLIVPDEVAYQQPGAHPMYLGVRNMVLFARKAGIGALHNTCAVAYRAGREGLGRLRRGKSMGVAEAYRGWRDGRRGLSGKP